MSMTNRTVYELRCDIAVCTSLVSGPSHQAVWDTAMCERGGWDTAAVAMGHGHVELVHRCPLHNGHNGGQA